MAKKFNLKVVTPVSVPYEGEAEMVILPGILGEFAILGGHMPLVTALTNGVIKIQNGDEEKVAAIHGGLTEITDSIVTVNAPVFEWPDEIDQNRAREERDKAEREMNEAIDATEKRRAEVAMRRAVARIEVASYSTTGKGYSSASKG